jgi:hypothetical protein
MALPAIVEICLLVYLTLRSWRHIQNLCGFSTPTAMGQSFIMTLYILLNMYIARNFFLQSNTRVCRSKLPSGWRRRVIFLLQTLVCQDCSKNVRQYTYLSLVILYRVFHNSRRREKEETRNRIWMCNFEEKKI